VARNRSEKAPSVILAKAKQEISHELYRCLKDEALDPDWGGWAPPGYHSISFERRVQIRVAFRMEFGLPVTPGGDGIAKKENS
jgi:hypothetical protein